MHMHWLSVKVVAEYVVSAKRPPSPIGSYHNMPSF